MADQLVFPFRVRPHLSRADFIVAEPNRQAVQFIDSWPDWPARAAALYGPPRSGKSHLAQIWAAASGAVEIVLAGPAPAPGGNGKVVPANIEATERRVAELSGAAAILIEDMDLAGYAPSFERDRLLMALFERPGTHVLFTGRGAPSTWPAATGDVRSRFDALLAFPLWQPDEVLLGALVRKHFADRQLEVSEGVVARILIHVERTPEAVAAFVGRIDAKALSEQRPVTERLVTDLIEAEGRS